MMPAAVLSLLVKAEGATAAAAQLTALEGVAKKASVGMNAAGSAAEKSGAAMAATGAAADKAAVGYTKAGTAAQGAAAKQAELDAANKRGRASFDQTAHKAGLLALGVAGIGAAAVKTAGDYQQSMNVLRSISGATGAEMDKLGKLAIKLGADTKLPGTSAKDASEAMTEMVKAGVSLKDTMSGVRGVLVLSAAAGVGNARAAEIASNALNAFKLKGKDVNVVVDQLANTANSSSVEINDVADSFKMAAAVFNAFQTPTLGAKKAMTELNVEIGLLGNAGIKGSDAGTSLKQMLLQLTGPSGKAKDAMRALYLSARDNSAAQGHLTEVIRGGGKDRAAALAAIEKSNPALKKQGDIAFDASGKMRSLKDTIKLVALGTKGMTDEQKDAYLTQIFGADATRAVTILLQAQGQEWDRMSHAVGRSGAAQDLANAKMKGFKGSLEALKSSLETMAIGMGTKLLPALTSFVKTFTSIVGLLSPTAWVLLLGVIGTLAATVWTVNAAIKVYEAVAKLATAAQWLWNAAMTANPIGLVIVGLAALAVAIALAIKHWDAIRGVLEGLWGWIKNNWPLLLAVLTGPFGLAVVVIAKHTGDIKNAVVGAFRALIAGVKGMAGAIKGLGGWTIARIVDGIHGAAGALLSAAGWIKDQIVRAMHALVSSPLALGSWFVGRFLDGIRSVGNAIKNAAKGVVDKLVGAVKGFLGISSPSKVFEDIGRNMMKGLINGMGATDVMKFVGKHLGGLVKSAAGAVGGLIGPTSGIPNASTSQIKGLGRQLAAGYGWQGGPEWVALDALWSAESGWNPRINSGGKVGPWDGTHAYGIPQALPPTKMGAKALAGDPGSQIAWGLGYIKSRYGSPAAAYAAWSSRHPHWYASGGKVPGQGTGDSVPAMLTPGEFVMRKQAVDKFGPAFFAGLNGYKKGGLVLADFLDSKFGLHMTSGYRTPQQNAAAGGVPNSWHTKGTPDNPGAIDLVGAMSQMRAALAWVKANVSGLAEAMIHNVGSGLHLHIAGRGLMNFVQGAGKGGQDKVSPGKKVSDALNRHLDYIDLQVQAGVLNQQQGAGRSRALINKALPKLHGSARLQALAKRRQLPKPPKPPKPFKPTVNRTLENPWLQAYLGHQDYLVASGALTQAQGNVNKTTALQNALPQLPEKDKTTALGMISDMAPVVGDAERFSGVLADRLSEIDLQQRAGDLSEAQARATKIQTIQENLGNPDLSDRERLEFRAELADLMKENTQAVEDQTAALNALKDEVKRQTDFATSVASTESAAMAKWVTEVISKQMGFGIGGRGQTPGYGVARRT